MTQAIKAGTLGYVDVDGDLNTRPMPLRTMSFTNNVGGTEHLPKGRYLVRLNDRGFHDYETGAVLHGNLVDEKDIETARRIGTSEYGSEYWKEQVEAGEPHAQDHYDRTLKAEQNFDPSYVMFHLRDDNFTPVKKELQPFPAETTDVILREWGGGEKL